ncbi:MAG: serine/threonine protein kinase [Oscillatoriaceae bacterium SKW80]|nr:serine/threonine protein kinase [Oscillatoriaceae bacterium SKYG93]MCX8120559.1 serine/threonine protein kinase [Oscillatoriaceae bacterium SKW80]MDW8453904.1 serine/threonine-protein kinase [Oscillatoriaceae cyanobacterium SKYGB_i_bin93]HIK27133.1 serine/threonine protein kinase [Oscillatoriaceae cyanobacterium M7585_C2015_266]
MEIQCTRPNCPQPINYFADIDNKNTLQTVQQKYCISCGMPLILGGRYIPIQKLGKGGFGTAYLARDRYTPTMGYCVVKQFQPPKDLLPQQIQTAQELFEREATVLEELGNKHPQIPNLFAFFPLEVPSLQTSEKEKFFYIVQEFIDGQNLEEELAQKGPFSEMEVKEVLKEILKVLKFVHDNGSIHRDIKPSNIMRARTGKLYLLDFGAVKKVTQVPGKPVSANSNTGIYTSGFAPPEQIYGGEIYPSTDLYALAATCITLLTGKQPTELFDTYKNKWIWRNYAPNVNNKLADILERMLLSTPEQRFQSADEVLAAFSPQPRFSTLEILMAAAFTGFESGLLFIALGSILDSPEISLVLWALILLSLIFAQSRRLIKEKHMPIIAIISLIIVLFSPLRGGFPREIIILSAVFASFFSLVITTIFRFLYNLLLRIF